MNRLLSHSRKRSHKLHNLTGKPINGYVVVVLVLAAVAVAVQVGVQGVRG